MSRIAPSRLFSSLRLHELEQRMQSYYAAVSDYPAFHIPSHHPLEWRHVLVETLRRIRSGQLQLTILEFGCGRTGFPRWLREQLAIKQIATNKVSITCQDVTATNQPWLNQEADGVLISPLKEGVLSQGSFDIIFSTHCLEHVAQPEQLLITLNGLLKAGGALLLFAPRYDLPFYLSPSSSNLPFLLRLLLGTKLLLIRLLTVLSGRPAFVIDTNPACLDRPFVRDADAIHWVSAMDLCFFARRNGLAFLPLDVSHSSSFLSKQWLIDAFCKLAVRLEKKGL